jgi:hypothetical protein
VDLPAQQSKHKLNLTFFYQNPFLNNYFGFRLSEAEVQSNLFFREKRFFDLNA